MSVQEGLGRSSEMNALLLHVRQQSSREKKDFPRDSAMTDLGHESGSTFDSQASDLSSICNTVWTLELERLGSNPGSHTWATLVVIYSVSASSSESGGYC